jgi:hypothetical protein
MTTDRRQPKPRGFGVCSRIVYVHQAILLAIFVAGLRVYPARGIDELVLPHWIGIVLSIAVLIAMFGVAIRKSLNALNWLRAILWIGVIKILVVQLLLLAQGQTELGSYIRAMFMNEGVAIPLAMYWSRPIHATYLASLRSS